MYHSFLHDTAIWAEHEPDVTCCDPQYQAVRTYSINYIMMGDTVINNLEYKKIFWQQVGCFSSGICLPCGDNIGAAPVLTGFIREDSSHKVYYLSNLSNPTPIQCTQETFESEKILYDFGVNVGDTVEWKPFNNVVLNVDSVQAPNGDYLKRIQFGTFYEDFWIEGLGSTIGLLGSYQPSPFECECGLYCAEASDLLPQNAPPPCGGIISLLSNPEKDNNLTITPNPVLLNSYLTIHDPAQMPRDILFFDLVGRLIYHENHNTGNVLIATNNFSHGCYMVIITKPDQTIFKKLLVIQ